MEKEIRAEVFPNVSVLLETEKAEYKVFYLDSERKPILVFSSPIPWWNSFSREPNFRKMASDISKVIKPFLKPEERPFCWGVVYESLSGVVKSG
jgi:hypothetical protein